MMERNEEARAILSEISRGITIEKAFATEKKMFNVKATLGEETLHKLLCFVIKTFQDSLHITNPANEMSAIEIIDAADMLMGMQEGQFGRESVNDVIMALRYFKMHPFDLYNSFSELKLRQIMVNYIDHKSAYVEQYNRNLQRITEQQGMTSDQIRSEVDKNILSTEAVRAEYERSASGKVMLGVQSAKERELGYKRRLAASILKKSLIIVPESDSESDSESYDVPDAYSSTEPDPL